jgi:hypothetical protein
MQIQLYLKNIVLSGFNSYEIVSHLFVTIIYYI